MLFGWKKDYLAGALIAAIGAFAILQSQTYRMGDITRVGPGVFPTVIGVLMVLIGAMIAGAARSAIPGDEAPHGADWRGRGCVVAGPMLFVVLGNWFGLALATFACVFVSALGDREATPRSAATLALVITVIGVALFSYLLQVPFPIFRWPDA